MRIHHVLCFVVLAGCGGGEDDPAVNRFDFDLATAPHASVCDAPSQPGYARCHARVITDGSGRAVQLSTPQGFGPADLQAAYALGAANSTDTVAIVDAYDDPNVEADLAVYRKQFGLPPCTTANGCFKKVNQSGKASPLPRGDSGWGQEISLDVDMVSAVCPTCKILLVEASSAAMTNLGAAVNTAVALGAVAVSNSYGGNEYATELNDETYYNHPGVAITVSSGDEGYNAEFPASSRYVIAVGGTHLVKDTSARGFSETAWTGASSGCSAYIPKPSWQTDTGCAKRSIADVSAVADPNTGVAVYDSYGRRGQTGWMVFGGTSASAPIIASVFARANNAGNASNLYANPSALFDVTSGSNGSCSVSYLCISGPGYDGPTGLGTPNGLGAF
jgi:subtilase family serine protease